MENLEEIWTRFGVKSWTYKRKDCQTKIYERSLEMTFVDETTN